MGDEVLRSTNMLRGMRGEPRLEMEQIKSGFVGGAPVLDGSVTERV